MPEQYKKCEWIGFNYAASTARRAGKGVHFFLDDYQFERVWNNPDRYNVKRKRLSVGRKDEELGKERLIDRTGRILWQT